MKTNGFNHKKRFGQNFISDANYLKSLVAAAGITGDDNVLEIGAGAGGLTRALADAAKYVVAYEIDRDLEPVLTAALAGLQNVRLIFADALKADATEILSYFSQITNEDKRRTPHYKLVANLPYYITTPLIFKFLDAPGCAETSVMIQKEVAERLTAREGTEDYGALTVAVAVSADVKILKRVDRKLFYPVPDVDSAFVSIKRNENKFQISDRALLSRLIKCAFAMRRKTLANNLTAGFSMTRAEAEELLKSAKLPPAVRGEALPPEKFVELAALIGFLQN